MVKLKKTEIQQTKGFLQNRKLAWIITIVVAVAASFLGVGRSLNSMRQEVVTSFESGDDGTGKGIAYEVKQIQDNSWNFLSVGKKYPGIQDETLKALEDCCIVLSNAETPGEIYADVQNLLLSIEDLYDELENQELTETDESYLMKLYTNIQSSVKVSQMNSYNERAADFNQLIKTMPAGVFNQLIRIKPLELYN